jgi:hypothetical protein
VEGVSGIIHGFSLNEIVISEEKPTLAVASMDMIMLTHSSARERTEVEWREILKRVELRG